MTNVPAIALSFEDKLKERVRESIGDLMTDEDIKKITDRCIEDIFFKERVVERSYGRQEVLPSVMHEVIKTAMEPLVQKAVIQYTKDNQKILEEMVNTFIGEAFTANMISVLRGVIAQPLANSVNEMMGRICKLESNTRGY